MGGVETVLRRDSTLYDPNQPDPARRRRSPAKMKGITATAAAAAGRRRGSSGAAADVASTVLTVATWTATLTAGLSAFYVRPSGQSHPRYSLM